MVQILEVVECQNSCSLVIEHDVGDALQFLVTCDRHSGQHGRFLNRCINGDDPLDSALGQKLRIAAQQRRIVAMDDCEEEIVALPQILLDAANDR